MLSNSNKALIILRVGLVSGFSDDLGSRKFMLYPINLNRLDLIIATVRQTRAGALLNDVGLNKPRHLQSKFILSGANLHDVLHKFEDGVK
jgi:hypothetical protein